MDEELEEFAERVLYLAKRSFPEQEIFAEEYAVEKFLAGVKEKTAALTVMERRVKTLDEAISLMKIAITNIHTIYGDKTPKTVAVVENDLQQQVVKIISNLQQSANPTVAAVRPVDQHQHSRKPVIWYNDLPYFGNREGRCYICNGDHLVKHCLSKEKDTIYSPKRSPRKFKSNGRSPTASPRSSMQWSSIKRSLRDDHRGYRDSRHDSSPSLYYKESPRQGKYFYSPDYYKSECRYILYGPPSPRDSCGYRDDRHYYRSDKHRSIDLHNYSPRRYRDESHEGKYHHPNSPYSRKEVKFDLPPTVVRVTSTQTDESGDRL